MSIGTKIRQLRREKDLTQEQLAEYLGITAKAVSQWETDRTAPDLSQLPILCNLFKVTSDTLLEIDISSKQKKIDDIYNAAYETAANGDHKSSINMWLEGIKRYPDAFKLILEYVNEVYIYSQILDDRDVHVERALSYIDRIFLECTDSKIRNGAVEIACMWYPKIDKTQEAIELASTLPDITCDEMLTSIYTGKKQHEIWCQNIVGKFTRAIGDLSSYARCVDDEGNDIFSDSEKIALCKKQIEMFKLFFEQGDYMYHSQYIELPYRTLATIYARNNDDKEVLNCLFEAAKYAIKFDTYDYEAEHKSLITRGDIAGGVWWYDEHNRSFDLLEWIKNDKTFDFVRKSKDFEKIIERLESVAK